MKTWEDKLDKLNILSHSFMSYSDRQVSVNYDELKKFIDELLAEDRLSLIKELEEWADKNSWDYIESPVPKLKTEELLAKLSTLNQTQKEI